MYPGLPRAFQGVVAPKERMYDPIAPGGTTTLVVSKDRQLLKHYVSLAGTSRNCGGGKTLWGSWISCEETISTPEHPANRGRCKNATATTLKYRSVPKARDASSPQGNGALST